MLAATDLEPPAVSRTKVISSPDDVVSVAADARLMKSAYLELRHVSCKFREGILTLRGCVPSYYLKQIAQNVVSQLTGVARIDNQVDVVPLSIPRKIRTCRPRTTAPVGRGNSRLCRMKR